MFAGSVDTEVKTRFFQRQHRFVGSTWSIHFAAWALILHSFPCLWGSTWWKEVTSLIHRQVPILERIGTERPFGRWVLQFLPSLSCCNLNFHGFCKLLSFYVKSPRLLYETIQRILNVFWCMGASQLSPLASGDSEEGLDGQSSELSVDDLHIRHRSHNHLGFSHWWLWVLLWDFILRSRWNSLGLHFF